MIVLQVVIVELSLAVRDSTPNGLAPSSERAPDGLCVDSAQGVGKLAEMWLGPCRNLEVGKRQSPHRVQVARKPIHTR